MCNRGGYIISYNGSRITDLSTGKVVYQKNIEVEQVKEIIDIADSLGVPLTTYKDDIAVTQKANDKYFELEVSINKLEVKRTDNLLEEIKYPVPKFLITGEPEALEKAEKEMSERLKDVTVFRYILILARSSEKDITGFFEKSACDKAFSSFFINPYCLTCSGCDTFSFLCEPKKIF